jgi:hypothetical protein
MRAVLERAPFDPAFASLKENLYRSGSAGFRTILRTAARTGDLPAGLDIPLTIDQLAGPLFYRRLFAGLEIDEKYVEAVVDSVLRLHKSLSDGVPSRHRRMRTR